MDFLDRLTSKYGHKFKHIDEAFENVTGSKKDDNGYKDCCDIKLSSGSGSRGRSERSLLLNCSVHNIVENHQGYEGNEVEDEY